MTDDLAPAPRPLGSIAVFCGSASGSDPRYEAAAEAVGTLLADRGITVVYGGGRVGLMGVVADAALKAGGAVTGIIPKDLADREVAHPGLTELQVVDTMHERKAAMAESSDAFVALPGGAGTLEEIAEQWTWAQLGIHGKPCGFLNVAGYWSPLLQMVDRMTEAGFVSVEHAGLLLVEEEFPALLERFEDYRPPAPKWLQPPPPPEP